MVSETPYGNIMSSKSLQLVSDRQTCMLDLDMGYATYQAYCVGPFATHNVQLTATPKSVMLRHVANRKNRMLSYVSQVGPTLTLLLFHA